MGKTIRAVKLIGLTLATLLLVAIVGVLAIRAYLQHVTSRAIAIHGANAIEEQQYVKIGGIDQWIQIRGQDRANPVLLCLHGGPGATWSPLTELFVSWEKDFTVVQWDQRGAGKTLETTGRSVADTITVDRMVQDGIEVSEFLRNHLHKDKIIILGHSWGSILGIHMSKERPDLFYAFVGTGQVANMPRSLQMGYAEALKKARIAQDEGAIRELEKIGPPPFDSLEKMKTFFKWGLADQEQAISLSGQLRFRDPNSSLWDMYSAIRGFTAIPTLPFYQAILSTDLLSLESDFKIPIYFFQGAEDQASLVQEYFEAIHAPHKELVLIEGEGHFVVWTKHERFLRELVARVRPLAAQP